MPLWYWWGALLSSWVLLPYGNSLSWNAAAIKQGEFWRLITGNLCHSNFVHWLMNALALSLIYFIYRDTINNRTWLCCSLTLCLLGGLTLFFSVYADYVGLSGLIHGLLAFAAINDLKNKSTLSGWVVIIALSAKLFEEQRSGASAVTESLIALSVAVDAHLHFALWGGVLGLVYWGLCHNKLTSKQAVH